MAGMDISAIPLTESIQTIVSTIKVLVGGVFGVYLIILYFRWREFILVRKLLKEIKQDIRTIAEKQGIDLDIENKNKKTFREKMSSLFFKKKEAENSQGTGSDEENRNNAYPVKQKKGG